VGKLRRRREDVVQRQTSQILGIRGWRSQRGVEASSAERPGTISIYSIYSIYINQQTHSIKYKSRSIELLN